MIKSWHEQPKSLIKSPIEIITFEGSLIKWSEALVLHKLIVKNDLKWLKW